MRAVVAAVASLALVGGTAPGALAAETMTAAQHCQAEKQDVRQAKKKLKKAKKAKTNRAAKVKKAKKNLKKQKRQKARWCSKAKSIAAANAEADKQHAAYTALSANPALAALPAEVRDPMLAAFAEALARIEALSPQFEGVSMDLLAQMVSNLTALDPTALQTEVEALAAQVNASGDPAGLQTVITALLGGGLDGLDLQDQAGLKQVEDAFQDLISKLEAFDPTGSSGQVESIAAAVKNAAAKLQANAGLLDQLLQALTELNGGTMPSDPLVVVGLIEDLVSGDVTVPGLPGLGDLLDPIVDPLDPILEPLPCIPLPLIPCP